MTKNPLTTLISTSEGIVTLVTIALIVWAIVTNKIPFMDGLQLLGIAQGVLVGGRSVVKAADKLGKPASGDDVKAQILEAIDEMKSERHDGR